MSRQRVSPANRAKLMVALILVTGLALTGGAFRLARRSVAHDFLHAFNNESTAQVADLATYLNARLLFLDDLARHLELSGPPDPEDFHAFVATERRRVEGIQALEWAPMVMAADRPAVEASIHHGHAGFAGFTQRDAQGKLQAAQARPWYLPVAFVEPLEGNQPALGFDLVSNPERRAAIEAARDSGQPRASGPVTLVQERQLQAGFLIFVPVYGKGLPAGTVAQRREALRGMVLGVFRTSDLLGAALGTIRQQGLRGELQDLEAHWANGPIHQWNSDAGAVGGRSLGWFTQLLLGAEPVLRDRLVFAGRTWEATFRPTRAFLANQGGQWVWLIPPAGVLLTVLLAALFHLTLRQKDRAEQAVRERTLALKESLTHLASREDDLRLLLDSTAEAIYGLDLKGCCTFCNRALLRMAGYPDADSLKGRNMHQLLHHSYADGTPLAEEDCRIFLAFRQGRGTSSDEEVFWRADGTSFPVEYRSFPQYRDGKVIGAVVSFMDITGRVQADLDQARLQAQLHQAQKMESLGSLAGGVAHDMNNVLGAILGLASASGRLLPEGSQASRAFETIAKAATRGGKMVKGLLSFARQGTAEELEVDLNALLREGAQLLAQTTLGKVRIDLDLGAAPGLLRGDAGALTHAFMNLFVNALDAMGGAGLLILRTRNLDADWLEVTVEDTGEGMAPEVAERAFDPFFTTKAPGQGTGLGLAMVYSTIKAHKGLIDLQSELGRGTRVVMRFPTAVADTPGVAPLPEPELESAGPVVLEVLLVDDDEFIQESMGSILELLGHRHQAVCSGEAALAALAQGADPDVVILDMNMPGLGGCGTLPRLRALRPHLPVLLATGRVDQDALDLVHAHENVNLLAKPFSAEALQRALMAVVHTMPGEKVGG